MVAKSQLLASLSMLYNSFTYLAPKCNENKILIFKTVTSKIQKVKKYYPSLYFLTLKISLKFISYESFIMKLKFCGTLML